jgi:hypothetical protein
MHPSWRLVALLLVAAAPAMAQERIGVRVGDHPAHGRIVFDWPRSVSYVAEREGDRLRLRFSEPAALDLSAIRRPPRNIARLRFAESGLELELELRPGTTLRHFRLGNRVVVDVMDAAPARPRPAGAVGRFRPAPVAAPPPVAVLPPAELPAPAVPEPARLALPEPPPPRGGAALTIPAPAETGAALLQRGGWLMLVLDAPLPPEAVAALPSARHWSGPDAATLLLPLSAGPFALRREASAWVLEPASSTVPAARPLAAEAEPSPTPRLSLRVGSPGRAVAVPDPETGGVLLVGTLREPGGEALPQRRRLPQLDLLPTLQGVAVLPRADTVALRPVADRFWVIGMGPEGLSIGEETGAAELAAASMSRLMDLPKLPPAAMQERLRAATAAIGTSPPLARGAARMLAASTLLGLGLPQEAQSMASVAVQEDPRLSGDPGLLLLQGAAALLAGRLAEAASALEDPRLVQADEAALWRALLAEARAEAPGGAAPALARTLALALSYPEPLRQRLLPGIALALATGGEAETARRLLSGHEEDPAFGLARARLAEAEGHTEEALAQYAALAAGRDRLLRAAAIRQGVELRLGTGRLDPAGAAAALEAALFSWRGDAGELAARRRLAELKRMAGDRRGAFDLLQETGTLFPDQREALRSSQLALLREALAQDPPLSAAELFEEHGGLLPRGADEATAAALGTLAERLAALALPERAMALLRRALDLATDPSGRAVLGARLAGLALSQGDAAAALATLSGTTSPALEPELLRQRGLVEARALARLGDAPRAVTVLRGLGLAGLAPLADLLAEQQDWSGAAAALAGHLEAEAPPAPARLGPDRQRDLARLAAFASLAGDEPMLAGLRERYADRLAKGPLAETFQLLASAPVQSTAELPRMRQELDIARRLAGNLEALRSSPPSSR